MTPSSTPSVTPSANGPIEDPFEGTPYRLVQALAKGGMSQVFLVEHRRLGRRFVAKLLPRELAANPQVLDRFRIEAQSLGRLNHPNIVSVFGFETTRDGLPFIVTEYLQGRTVAQELTAGRVFAVREAIYFVRELLAALGVAHAIGIVHRDIKPQNLMLCEPPDGAEQLKVLDFGLARILPGVSARAPEPLRVPTDTGVVFGTPQYVSPEAALGQHVDQRADIYGAGLILYTMLARRGPFDTGSPAEAMAAHLIEQPEPPSRYAPVAIPSELDELVLAALRKEVTERIQTVSAFDECLAKIQTSLSLTGVTLTGVEPANEDAHEQETRAASGFTTTKTGNLDGVGSRRLTWRMLLALTSVTLLAALATLFIGGLLLARQGTP